MSSITGHFIVKGCHKPHGFAQNAGYLWKIKYNFIKSFFKTIYIIYFKFNMSKSSVNNYNCKLYIFSNPIKLFQDLIECGNENQITICRVSVGYATIIAG